MKEIQMLSVLNPKVELVFTTEVFLKKAGFPQIYDGYHNKYSGKINDKIYVVEIHPSKSEIISQVGQIVTDEVHSTEIQTFEFKHALMDFNGVIVERFLGQQQIKLKMADDLNPQIFKRFREEYNDETNTLTIYLTSKDKVYRVEENFEAEKERLRKVLSVIKTQYAKNVAEGNKKLEIASATVEIRRLELKLKESVESKEDYIKNLSTLKRLFGKDKLCEYNVEIIELEKKIGEKKKSLSMLKKSKH